MVKGFKWIFIFHALYYTLKAFLKNLKTLQSKLKRSVCKDIKLQKVPSQGFWGMSHALLFRFSVFQVLHCRSSRYIQDDKNAQLKDTFDFLFFIIFFWNFCIFKYTTWSKCFFWVQHWLWSYSGSHFGSYQSNFKFTVFIFRRITSTKSDHKSVED